MLKISNNISILKDEITITPIRAQGNGGQNVNKVSTAIHLRFDINKSSLPDSCKKKLLKLNDSRLTKNGVIIIKAQRFRNQLKNRQDGLERLCEFIRCAMAEKKKRKPTKATKSSQVKRIENKIKRGRTKALRGKISDDY